MQIVLASASPRRRELLKELVPDFRVLPAKGEERADPSLSPEETVKELARQKAEEVTALIQNRECAVLGADTVVALDGKILGKPKDEADAFRMLSALSGRTHEVFTGVCLILPGRGKDGARRTHGSGILSSVRGVDKGIYRGAARRWTKRALTGYRTGGLRGG